jgi:hypothetical protein
MKKIYTTLVLLTAIYTSGAAQTDLRSTSASPNNPVVFSSRTMTTCGYQQTGNAFENGRISTCGASLSAYNGACADDILVPAGSCWNVTKVKFHQFCTAAPVSANITFMNDAGSMPGSIANGGTAQAISVPFTAVAIGSNFGLTIYELTCTLPSTITLCAGASPVTYWLSCQVDDGGNSTYWEFQTVNPQNIPGGFFSTPAMGPWSAYPTDDFVFSLNLFDISASQSLVICNGGSVTVGSSVYSTSGTYTNTLTAFGGCDSVLTTNLTVLAPVTGSQTLTGCTGYSVTVGTSTYNTTGTYTTTLTGAAANGCDSIVTTNLTINSPATSTQTLTGCTGYSVTVGTSTYNTTGTYTTTLTGAAANGCDSIVTTNLTINSPATGTQTLTGCTGYSVTVGTSTYNTTGTYTTTLAGAAANGCDSIVTTNLTINTVDNTTSTSALTITANASGAAYTWLDCSTNSVIPGETNQSFTATSNGNYAVQVTENGCVDTSACVAIMSVGINEQADASVSVYPNPTNGAVTVNTGMNGSFSYTVYTVEGKVVTQQQNVNGIITIDLNNEVKGVYFLRIEGQDTANAYKIIKL